MTHIELYTPQPHPVALDTAGRYICELITRTMRRSPPLWLPRSLADEVDTSVALAAAAPYRPPIGDTEARARALEILITSRGRPRVVIA